MSFVEADDVLSYGGGSVRGNDPAVAPLKTESRTPVAQALLFPSRGALSAPDKPDMRFGLELKDVSGVFARTEFGVLKTAFQAGGIAKVIPPFQAVRTTHAVRSMKLAETAGHWAQKALWPCPTRPKASKAVCKFITAEESSALARRQEPSWRLASHGGGYPTVVTPYSARCGLLFRDRLACRQQ